MPKSNNEVLGGKYLSTSNLSKDELVKRLKKLSTYLSEVEQDNVDTRDLDTAAAGLVQEVILHHKDKEVKIFAACCLADVIRIYAPDPPYNDVQLKEVFQLFIEQLGHLDPEKPTFDRYVYLLERLVLVKAFVLLVELDEDLVNELFATLFRVVSDEHSNTIRTHFLDIMVSCIEESTEVPNALLETVLQTLVSPYKNEHPAATKLGQLLIKRFSNLFQPIIAQYLVDLKEPDAQSELKDNYNELIFELNRISPSLIITVLPLLETELKIEDNSKRKNTVNLLQFMFGAKNSTLAANYRALFSVFLGRFNDKEADIRAKMLEFAKSYLSSHTQFVSDVNEGLRNRVLDPDIKIRQLAVEYVCDIASEVPDNVTLDTMTAVFERLQDKKEIIRKEAMKRLSSLYKKIIEKFGDDFSNWSEQSVTKFSKIPQKLLHCYFLPDLADKSRVEKHFDNLLPSDVDKKAKSMWKIYQSLDPNAVVAIQRILKEKKSFQTGFEALLEHRNDADSDEAKKKLTSLSNKLPYPDRAHEGLSKILTLKDNVTIKHLTTLYDVDVKYSTIKTAKAEVLKKLEGKKVNYCKKIVQHLALSFISKETVNVIYKSLKKLKADSKEFFSGLKLLQDISVVYPTFFSEIFSELSSLLEEKDESVVNNALMIMSNVGQTLQEKEPSLMKEVKDKLYDLCSTGTPFQAKQAVKAMQHMYQDKSGKIFGSLAKECVKQLDLKDKQLPTLLKTLGYIAELSPSTFDSVKTKVVNFLESLLEKSHSKKKSKDQNGPSSECEKKILAIKVLIHYLMASSEEDTEIIFLLLIKILSNGGELTSDESTSVVDRCYLSFTAGSGVVKLCRLPRYERRLSPEQFQLLASVVQSSESGIRAAFAKKLHKGLNTFQLPIRFMSLFSLAATDSEKSNIASARHCLANCIKLRQTYMKTNETISSKPTLQAQFMPEYSVPYLVHLLAHHEDIDEDKENKYENTYRCLSFYLGELYHTNNYSFLMNLLFGIRRTKDTIAPSSNNIHVIAEICNKELLRLSGAKKRGELNVAAPSVDMFLPPSLYSLPSESEAMDIIKQSDNLTNFTIPNKKATPKPKKSTESDEEKEEEDEEKEKKKTPKKTPQKTPKKDKGSDEEKAESAKKSSKKTPKKKEVEEEDKEEEEEEREEKKKAPSKKGTSKKSKDKDDSKKNSSKKGTKKSTKAASEDEKEDEEVEEAEEEEEEEEKESSSKKSTKKTTSKKASKSTKKPKKDTKKEEELEEEEEVPLEKNSKKRKSTSNEDSDKENKQKSKTNSKKQKKSTKN